LVKQERRRKDLIRQGRDPGPDRLGKFLGREGDGNGGNEDLSGDVSGGLKISGDNQNDISLSPSKDPAYRTVTQDGFDWPRSGCYIKGINLE
jgi:hypothetical protein